jgi:hypothetical protein
VRPGAPNVDHRERGAFGFRRQVVAEDLRQQPVHGRVEALLAETVGHLFGLPHGVVAQPAFGCLRAELSVQEAADVVWATTSSELFVLLTEQRGWSLDRYESFSRRLLATATARLTVRI